VIKREKDRMEGWMDENTPVEEDRHRAQQNDDHNFLHCASGCDHFNDRPDERQISEPKRPNNAKEITSLVIRERTLCGCPNNCA
jgi:hypothetical protein